MFNINMQQMEESYISPQNSPFKTPHKSKPSFANINSSGLIRHTLEQPYEPKVP